MPTLHVFAHILRWSQGTVVYTQAHANAYVELELSQDEWDALKVQMEETEAMIEMGLTEA